MQTFISSPDYAECASVLDSRRLNKSIVEIYQVMLALTGGKAWRSHPVTLAWQGYEGSLYDLLIAMHNEYYARTGRNHASALNAGHLFTERFDWEAPRPRPPFADDPMTWAMYRSLLLRKQPEHYRQYWPDHPDDLALIYPNGKVSSV